MGNVPDTKIVFNSDNWRMLERFISETKLDLDNRFLKAIAGLRLDGNLKVDLKPGSEGWAIVSALTDAAKLFGESVQTQFTTLTGDWDTFVQVLVEAERIFENHNDLATLSAQDLLKDYPDFAAGGR
jgi:hypothetical protein